MSHVCKTCAIVFLTGLVICCASCSQQRSKDSRLTAFDHSMNGNQLLHRGQTAKAVEEYKTAIYLDPRNWRRHYELAQAFVRNDMSTEAIKEYRQVIVLTSQVNPPFHNPSDYAFPHFWLGKALYENNQKKEAVAELQTAVRIGKMDTKRNMHITKIVEQSKVLLGRSSH